MPPKRAKKNASNASEDAIPSFPAPTTTTQQDEAHTPEQSPRKQTVGITQAQKQALMDNLQLESEWIRAEIIRTGFLTHPDSNRTRAQTARPVRIASARTTIAIRDACQSDTHGDAEAEDAGSTGRAGG